MQVTETLNEGLKRAYELILTAEELDAKVNAKLKEAQPEIEMKGFRKGKVPMPLLKKQFGQRLIGESMQEAVDEAMSKHFEDSGDRPALQPKIEMKNEDWKEGDDVNVEMSYEKLPEVPEVDMSAIEVEKLVAKADDGAVDEALASLAETAQDYKDRDEGAEAVDGDQVVIDFVGKVDGEPFEGGAAADYPLVLGSNSFIPGFEEQLVGVKAGDETTITVTFPQEYGAEHLAGKEATFDVMVKDVQAPAETAIDDEFAKSLGMDDLEALRGAIREQIQGNYASLARNKMKRSMLDALDDIHDFQLPPMMVEHEFNQIWGQLEHQLQHQNKTLADLDEPEDTVRAEYQKIAERRVRLGLVLARIGEENEITVGNDELNRALMQRAQQFPGQERQVYEFYQNNPNAIAELRAPIFEDKVIDYITELAKVTEKPVTVEELMASDDEDEGLPFIPEHDHDHDHGDHDHGDHDHAHEEGEETKA